ncbi:MAG TPA: threonine synthase [Acidobacteriota bacterium]
MNSYIRHLYCTKCQTIYAADRLQNLCACGGPLFADYDLKEVSKVLSREDLAFRVHSLWRYRELLPVIKSEHVVSLAEGFTPLIPSCRLGKNIGLHNLFFKDESFNPTGSFKSRGLSVAVSKAKELGAQAIALPTAGNAGGAASAYAARAGMGCHVFMPSDTPAAFMAECESYGATVYKVDGVITDAAREMQPRLQSEGWFDVSTLKEPYRVEGKKTILYELAQQMGWNLPDVILFPTGGGTGIVGALKACRELQQLGWVSSFKMPKFIAVQSAGCAPIVRAWQNGWEHAVAWEQPETLALGLRVPKAIGDFLILRAIRESNGVAVAVEEENIAAAWRELGGSEGMFVAPEAAACWAALQKLVQQDFIGKNETVVILVTGSGLKYVI